MGKTWAYKEFRTQRVLTNNPYILSDHLTSYSEKKEVYTELLKSMIKYNKFYTHDIDYDPMKEFKPKIKVKTKTKTEIKPNIDLENKTEIKSNDIDEIKSEVKTDIKTEIESKSNEEIKVKIMSVEN